MTRVGVGVPGVWSWAIHPPRRRGGDASVAEHRAFREQITQIDTGTRRLIFLDETGCNLKLARRCGYVPKGVRLVDKSVPRNTPPDRSLAWAISQGGILISMEVAGSMDGDAFFVFLEHCLAPCLRLGDVVLMDHLSTHKSKRMVQAIEVHGVEAVFLPPYSPEFNPIEGAWSKPKAYLRHVAARTPKALDRALARNACGWFKHAGYRTT